MPMIPQRITDAIGINAQCHGCPFLLEEE